MRRPVEDKALRPAVPGPETKSDQAPRCWRCGRVLAWHVGRPWRITCARCNANNGSEPG